MSYNQFDTLRYAAAQTLKFSRAWLEDPFVPAHHFSELMMKGAGVDPAQFGPDEIGAFYQNIMNTSVLAGRWGMAGLPTVTLGHRTAAALMATRLRPEDAAEFVRPPWQAFAIRIPDGLLTVEYQGVQRHANTIVATCLPDYMLSRQSTDTEPVWCYQLRAPIPEQRPPWFEETSFKVLNGISLFGYRLPTASLAVEDLSTGIDNYTRWETCESVTSDFRSDRLARALIASVCLCLSGDGTEINERHALDGLTVSRKASKHRRGDELPQYDDYEIRSNVKLDLHHVVRDYVNGTRTEMPSGRILVTPHWKRVAYGKLHALRRLQFIEAYHRGVDQVEQV